ncbi:MAG: glycosyltransferase family 2 protein [Armatimonadetes bacterium]|nr:glycosyltransferase family 2 protein [Armatimonadota bacterium]
MTPLVSTVIPTRNRAAMLAFAVRSALAQTDANGDPVSQEIIIADDCSTDNTLAVALALKQEQPERVRYRRVQTGTPGGTRNAGAKFATGKYLAFLDDDDAWLPGRLTKALTAFAASPQAGFVYAQATPTDAFLHPASDSRNDFPLLPLPEGHPVGAFLASPPHLNATLFRRDAFELVGGFNATLSGFEDADLMIRMVRRYPCVAVQEPLALMRTHADSLNSGVKVWQRFQDELRARRFHLSVRDDYRPNFAERLRLSLRCRGWYVSRFLGAVERATRREEVREGVRYALRTSPLHALKSPLLWRALMMKGGNS